MVEMLPLIQSDNGSLPRDSCLTRWWEWYSSMMLRVGRNPRIGRDLEALLREAGFADVGSRPVQVPVGAWLSGRQLPRPLLVKPKRANIVNRKGVNRTGRRSTGSPNV